MMSNLIDKGQESLKLDFNERSDYVPPWLEGVSIESDKLWMYPDKTELEVAIANKYKLTRDELLVTNGGDEAIELMFKLAKLNEFKVILPLPVFSQYWLGKDSWGIDCKLIEANDDLRINQSATLDAIEKNCILVITSPNNPTGETLSIAEITTLCEMAKSKGALVFLDCAYIEFTEIEAEYLALINQFDNLIMLRTLSKAYGLAAIRIGYLLGQKVLVNKFKALSMPFNSSQLNLKVAQMAFDKNAEEEVRDYCQKIKVNRQLLVNYLNKFDFNISESEGNFILIQGNFEQLQLINAACKMFNIEIKTKLSGLSKIKSYHAIRIGIPYNLDKLLNALKLALEPGLICFDMDGVLIDTSDSYDQCIIKTVEYFSQSKPTRKDILAIRNQGGFNNDWHLTQELLKKSNKNIELEKIVEIFQGFYLGDSNKTGLIANEKPFLNTSLAKKLFIEKSKSLRTAIVTGRGKFEAQQGLESLNIKNTLLISDDDVDFSKPSPEGIEKAKGFYQKQSTWMLGDAPDDMLAAKAAGAIAIGIGNQDLYKFGADIVLENVNEIEALL